MYITDTAVGVFILTVSFVATIVVIVTVIAVGYTLLLPLVFYCCFILLFYRYYFGCY